ncbi:MAG TPA: hypothetical protein VNS58_11995 [Puia sp.]|nr:hypothetical protein [Puia sp.]
MNRLLLTLLTIFFFLSSDRVFADQAPRKDTSVAATSTPNTPVPPDDEFNMFLLVLAITFFSVVIGAVIVGSFAAVLLLFFLFGLVSAGILTASLIVGLYTRSFSAGFKTLLVIVCSLGGIAAGSIALLLVNRIFRLHLSHTAAIGSGAAGGLVGGILLGLSISFIVRLLTDYFRKKLAPASA